MLLVCVENLTRVHVAVKLELKVKTPFIVRLHPIKGEEKPEITKEINTLKKLGMKGLMGYT